MYIITNPATKIVAYETDSLAAARELIADSDLVISYTKEAMQEFTVDRICQKLLEKNA